MRKKRAMTLMEIMIVIFLIGLIASVIGYNMKGSLDEGKAFRTERGIEQIKDILLLEVAKGDATIEEVVEEPMKYLKNSGLVKDPKSLLKDGWGKPLAIAASANGNGLSIHSDSLKSFKAKKIKSKGGKDSDVASSDNEESSDE